MNDSVSGIETALLRALAFPLNVYALALQLEEGRVHDLHYGLHETPGMPAAEAQRRAVELLWRHLPPPCRLLEIGVGLGNVLARLTASGYTAAGIAPDGARVTCAKARHGENLPAIRSSLVDFGDSPGEWDMLLFRESARHIEPLELFAQADRLLGEGGEILIVDEFALRRTGPGCEALHLLPHFIALGQRHGFAVQEQIDLSREAAPTLEYLQRVVSRHAEALQRELGVTTECIAALGTANAALREKYADDRAGYYLLKMKRLSRPRWRVGRVDAGNAGMMRALFEEIFHHPMSAAQWWWRYGEQRGAAIGVWEGARLIAHYGGVSREILYFGERWSAAQSCDVMVAPEGRGTLSRRGPLFLAAATYLENQLGYGNPHLLGVGYPNERAWKAPARLGLYGGPVGRMLELSWSLQRSEPLPAPDLLPLDLNDAADRADADACWSAMSADLKDMIVGVRDATNLHHRYSAHPDTRYQIFMRRRYSGSPLGLFVLRAAADGNCELLDLAEIHRIF